MIQAPTPGLVMVKPTGPLCNLDCSYCYYTGRLDLFDPEPRRMSDDQLEDAIKQILEAAGTHMHFEWHGGEPTLLGLSTFRKIVAWQRRHQLAGQTVTNGLQTNGTLIDADWAQFLFEFRFSVGLSLDGPAAMHDAYRVTRAGQPSHRQVVRALAALSRRRVHVDVLCVVHAANVHQPEEVYRYFRSIGVRYLQFLPLVERLPDGSMSERTPEPEAVGEFLCRVFDLWLAEDVGKVVVQWFDEAIRPELGLPHSLCLFRETCGDVPALEHDGTLYPCDHFVDGEHRLGSIHDHGLAALWEAPDLVAFGAKKRQNLSERCRQCDVLAWCNGGCPKDRLATSGDGEPGRNFLCAGLERFFQHVRPALPALARRVHDRQASRSRTIHDTFDLR